MWVYLQKQQKYTFLW